MRVRSLLSSVLAAATVVLANAPEAQASHFRYGTLQWSPTANAGQVNYDLRVALRRDVPNYGNFPGGVDMWAETGDIIVESLGGTALFFGDGGSTPTLRFLVTDFSVTENWIVAVALNPSSNSPGVLHTFPSTGGPWVTQLAACCRLSTSQLNNRGDGDYILETIVSPRAGNRSPVSSLVPIVVLPVSQFATFLVPAADPDGDRIRWRMSTINEAGGGNHPPNMTINGGTGQVTWDNRTLDRIRFWTAQVIIEDLDVNGAVKSKTPVDFLLKIVPQSGVTPTCAVNPPGPFTVSPGTLVDFAVTGTDTDAGEVIILNASGVPPGATTTPALPLSGPNGVTTNFAWIPTAAEVGSNVVSFSATDRAGQQGLCSATIIVEVNSPPTVSCPQPVTLNCSSPNGTPHTLTATVSDVDGDAISGSWRVNGVAVQPIDLPAGQTSADITLSRSWPLGTSNVEVEVSDGPSAPVSCTTTVTVVDTTPPVVTCNVTRSMLWPPNHKLLPVGLTATVTDACSGNGTATVEVWGDEDDEMPTGDGNHAPDADAIASGTLRLRSERRGDADGRVYLIIAQSMDGGANVATSACCTVTVPHSPNPRGTASVLAQAAAAQAVCNATGNAPAGYFVIGDGAASPSTRVPAAAPARTRRPAEAGGKTRERNR